MLKIFNSNYEEIGSLNKNLVLNTQGKIKIRFNKKFIDLLDNNGNINAKIPNIIEEKDDISKVSSNGIYLVNGILYIYCNKTLIKLTGQVVNDVEELDEDQNKLSGVEFIAPEEGEVIYPHYSSDLNNLLCNVEDEESIIDVVPTVKWINNKLDELQETIDKLSDVADRAEDAVAKSDTIVENITRSNDWNELKQIYPTPEDS